MSTTNKRKINNKKKQKTKIRNGFLFLNNF